MLVPLRQLTHQKQTGELNCASTCLSIVTGLNESEISLELEVDGFEEPYSMESVVRFLTRKSIHIEKVGGMINTGIMDNSIYLITCPSSVNPGMAHLIVGFVYGGYMKILDPADDLTEEKLYSSEDFGDGNIPCFEYYRLTDCMIID